MLPDHGEYITRAAWVFTWKNTRGIQQELQRSPGAR